MISAANLYLERSRTTLVAGDGLVDIPTNLKHGGPHNEESRQIQTEPSLPSIQPMD